MMSKFDFLVIKILLKVCDILSYYSEKISTTDIYTLKQEIEKINE